MVTAVGLRVDKLVLNKLFGRLEAHHSSKCAPFRANLAAAGTSQEFLAVSDENKKRKKFPRSYE